MSKPEAILAQQIAWAKLPEPVTEFAAINGRRYRFDLAWSKHNLLVEIQGGTSQKPVKIGGRGRWYIPVSGHNSMEGINRDCEKLNLAILAGWRVLHVDTKQIHSGQALKWIQEALG
ncbi:MAG: hypothetical protein C0436_04120 [Alphaproteobacteria bacterium]|nr:hypothetical protein [Alphaproteobacteria bacterium]